MNKDTKKSKLADLKKNNKEETDKLVGGGDKAGGAGSVSKADGGVIGDNDSLPNTFSMTQMLGLCSGKFDDSNNSTTNSAAGASSSAKVDASGDTGDQSSLNFHDDNANTSFANFTFDQHDSEKHHPDDESTRACGMS